MPTITVPGGFLQTRDKGYDRFGKPINRELLLERPQIILLSLRCWFDNL